MSLRQLRNGNRPSLPPLAVDSGLAAILIGLQILTDLSAPLAGLAIVPVSLRRRLPRVAAFLMGAILTLGEILMESPDDESFLPITAAILIVLYSVGSYERSLPWSIAAGVFLAAGARADLIINGLGADTFWPFTVLFMGGAWIAGRIVHQRRTEAEDLSVEATHLREQQEIRTSQAVAEERGRLARELHDVIAHNVSLMVVQAGAADQVLDGSTDQVREALVRIQQAGRQTVVELRRLLGILRSDEQGLETSPQPSLAGLDVLVEQVRRSGLRVDVGVEGAASSLPVSLDLSAYRILQEGLTNVLRHAGATKATVAIRYSPRLLELEVVDDGRGTRDRWIWGHGLLGIRERVALFDGTLETGNRADGGFFLRAKLPVEAEST
jgi:signal transduction histidine kinase